MLLEQALDHLRNDYADRFERSIFFDNPKLSIYGQAKGGQVKTHKKLWIHQARRPPKEIIRFSKPIQSLLPVEVREIGRLYFLHEEDRESVRTHLLRALTSA